MLLTTLLAQDYDVAASTVGAGTAAAFAGVWLFILVVVIGLNVVGLVLWIWALIDLLKREFTNPDDRTTWLIVLIVGLVVGLGWLAAVIYLVVGRKKGTLPENSSSEGGSPEEEGPSA